MFTWKDFVITSTDCDDKLFFNPDYERVVNKAIADLAEQHHWKKVNGWNLLCFEYFIRIDNKKKSYVYLIDRYNTAAPEKAYCCL